MQDNRRMKINTGAPHAKNTMLENNKNITLNLSGNK